MTARRETPPMLVGRDDELRRLRTALAAPPAVVTVVVTVVGEAGIGKTRLVAEAVAHPQLAGRCVVVGACRRIREPFPLGPLVEALRGLRDELAADRLSPVAGALRPLLPELADVLPPRPEPLDDRIAERHRVFRGLVAVLESLGQAVVVVEDLHWVDYQTMDFLSYLLADPPAGLCGVDVPRRRGRPGRADTGPHGYGSQSIPARYFRAGADEIAEVVDRPLDY